MNDTTNSTEKMHLTPDADGRDQFVNDGAVATLLIHEGTELEIVLDNDGILPDPGNSANPVIKYVLQWVKDSISMVADRWTHGNIGNFDNEIYMTGMKSSDDTKVDNIRPQVGRFVSLDNPNVKVLSSSRSNANDGNFRYYDNEIDMVDLVCLKGTNVNNIEPRTGRLVFSDGSGRFASDLSSFEQFPSLDLSFETVERRLFNCIVRKCLIVDSFGDRMCRARKNQWQALTAHQSKKGRSWIRVPGVHLHARC